MSQHTVLRPDIAIFLSPSAKQIDLDLAPVPFPPEIAVEILSPADKAVQINRKLRHYLAAGTQEVWIFDPANAEVFLHTPYSIRLLDGTMLLETPLLPGFRPSVAEILAPPTP